MTIITQNLLQKIALTALESGAVAKPVKDKGSSVSKIVKNLGRQTIVEADQDMTADPISVALKRMHDAIIDEPLPDEFLALIEQIDAKIAGRKQTE